MPKMVDSDERRAVLIDATSRQIAERGLGNVTLRSIARVNGWSTGIVTHYFADKRELLMATFRERADRARRHIETEIAAGRSLLEASVDAALPLDEARMLDWRVFLAYMGASIGEPELDVLFRERQQSFRDTLAEAIADEVIAGRLPAGSNVDHEAARLLVTLNGVAIQAVLAPDLWSADQQRRVINDHLTGLRRTELERRTT